MELLPFRTKRFLPPQDDLFSELDRLSAELKNGDVVLVSAKVVAISEGRCEQLTEDEKRKRVHAEADVVIDRPYWPTPLTIVHHSFIGAAGLDESNGNGYCILLPEHPFASAEHIHAYLTERTGCAQLGVVLTDSRSLPLRFGATGVGISWWGIAPLLSHIGEHDLFGRALRYERSNIIDGLAAAACLVMGETDAQTPIVVARNVPDLTFVSGNTANQLLSSFSEDTFRVLYEQFLPIDQSDRLKT